MILALSGVVAAGLQEPADPHLQACVHLFKLFPTSVLRSPQFLPVNDCEMLMQLIREAQGREGSGFIIKEGYVGVKRRLWVKIKSAQGEVKSNESITGS